LQFSSNSSVKLLLARFEGIIYDLRLRATLVDRTITDQTIIIIDIDEKSLAAEGRWPWSRQKVATMVNNLADAGVAVVAFDVLFSEPERNPADSVTQHLEANNIVAPPILLKARDALDADAIFAASLNSTDVVLGILFQGDESITQGELPFSVVKSEGISDLSKMTRISFNNYESNIKVLQSQTPGSGFINASYDGDGIIRRAALVAEYNGQFYPSLALEAARLLTLTDTIDM
jgi:adenylate cyclase